MRIIIVPVIALAARQTFQKPAYFPVWDFHYRTNARSVSKYKGKHFNNTFPHSRWFEYN